MSGHEFLTENINLTAKAFLFFTQEKTVIVLLCIGFFGYNKKKITRALFLFLFSMILNAFLKSLFKVPLAHEIGAGFAFPSGHMQNSAVLWGWLSLEVNRKSFFAFSLLLLCGIAFGLIQLGYHSLVDILGALVFALILLMLYPLLLKCSYIKNRLATAGFTLFLFALPMIYSISPRTPAIFIAPSALIGFSIGTLPQNVLQPLNTIRSKVKSTLLAIAGALLIQIGFKYFPLVSKEFSLLCCYFLTGLWLSAGVSKCL